MDDQPETPLTPGPFAHLAHKALPALEVKIIAFNDARRRKGSKKLWHDFHPQKTANDPPEV